MNDSHHMYVINTNNTKPVPGRTTSCCCLHYSSCKHSCPQKTLFILSVQVLLLCDSCFVIKIIIWKSPGKRRCLITFQSCCYRVNQHLVTPHSSLGFLQSEFCVLVLNRMWILTLLLHSWVSVCRQTFKRHIFRMSLAQRWDEDIRTSVQNNPKSHVVSFAQVPSQKWKRTSSSPASVPCPTWKWCVSKSAQNRWERECILDSMPLYVKSVPTAGPLGPHSRLVRRSLFIFAH